MDECCPISICTGGDINIKLPYKRVLCTENIISRHSSGVHRAALAEHCREGCRHGAIGHCHPQGWHWDGIILQGAASQPAGFGLEVA